MGSHLALNPPYYPIRVYISRPASEVSALGVKIQSLADGYTLAADRKVGGEYC